MKEIKVHYSFGMISIWFQLSFILHAYVHDPYATKLNREICRVRTSHGNSAFQCNFLSIFNIIN